MIKKLFLLLIPAMGLLISSCGNSQANCQEQCATTVLQSHSKCLNDHRDDSRRTSICGDLMFQENTNCVAIC